MSSTPLTFTFWVCQWYFSLLPWERGTATERARERDRESESDRERDRETERPTHAQTHTE